MATCVHFSRSLPSNSWWQTMAGWQALSRPSAAEGGGRRPAFTGLATQPSSATEVDGWQHKLSRVSQNRAAVQGLSGTACRRINNLFTIFERSYSSLADSVGYGRATMQKIYPRTNPVPFEASQNSNAKPITRVEDALREFSRQDAAQGL